MNASKYQCMMQIYADVTNREIHISDSAQMVVLGSAMFGWPLLEKNGGYDSIFKVAKVMPRLKDVVYKSNSEAVVVYKKHFMEYDTLQMNRKFELAGKGKVYQFSEIQKRFCSKN